MCITGVLHVHNRCTTCAQQVYYICVTGVLHVHDMCITCAWQVYYMCVTDVLHVHNRCLVQLSNKNSNLTNTPALFAKSYIHRISNNAQSSNDWIYVLLSVADPSYYSQQSLGHSLYIVLRTFAWCTWYHYW